MTKFLQYIGFVLVGYLSGGFVNFVVDWFYIRRKFLDENIEKEILRMGWSRYLAWPFLSQHTSLLKKLRLLFVQVIFIVLTLVLGISPPDRVEFWWGLPVLIYFTIVIVMDVEYRVVLHPISIAGVILGAIVGVYLRGPRVTIGGGVVGFLIMFLLYKFGEVFMRWVNKRRGLEIDEVALGFGDVNLSGVIGLFLGWPPVILGLLFAIFIGGIVSLIFMVGALMLRRCRMFSAVPYAPFLAIAALIMLFFPDAIAALLP